MSKFVDAALWQIYRAMFEMVSACKALNYNNCSAEMLCFE